MQDIKGHKFRRFEVLALGDLRPAYTGGNARVAYRRIAVGFGSFSFGLSAGQFSANLTFNGTTLSYIFVTAHQTWETVESQGFGEWDFS
jgi:hypothetical protein